MGEKWISEKSYIQEGLAFQLDGIVKGTDNGTWIDLIGGVVFTSVGTTLMGNNYVQIPDALLSDRKIGGFSTVEICISDFRNFGAFIIGSKEAKGMCMSVYTSGNDVKDFCYRPGGNHTGSAFAYPDTVLNASNLDKGTLSANDNLMMCRGIVSTDKFSADFAPHANTLTSIGKRAGGGGGWNFTSCKIHSIRFYNRNLTSDEMLFNQRIDNLRFNLGLSI